MGYNLDRFLSAQETSYLTALAEIQRGRKTSHWMWYIFPQISGLGQSDTARFYAIRNGAEAKQYLEHPVLGKRLVAITAAVLQLEGKTAHQIFGSPDDLKLKSSMTLFNQVSGAAVIFRQVLDKYYGGAEDSRTIELLATLE